MDDKLRDLLIKHEGVRLFPYEDSVGKLSIGVGRNLSDCGITAGECDLMLTNDIQSAEMALIKVFPDCLSWAEARRIALVDMMFNIGPGAFAKFKRMISAVKQGDWKMAAYHMMDSVWAAQVPARAAELAKMVATGEWA